MKTSEEFNEKYKEYLEGGHYGLNLENQEAIDYLDGEFQELIKIPDFEYSQIKQKFNFFRFYANNVSNMKALEIEQKLKEIYNI